eukprot:CAMPEP_0182499508 /NCGR_PEP_ID=MMETSP1321-20130603/7767_1 /TAXON_ID=91990 /ORGANISM="Bolidomonas sp., Strain RCC1657" /LENGTH=81 /DNA_ID=CAMNT_0024703719 /DNA_START=29 /DNA_END=274 /DNA_ORIENTATION=-
MANPLFPGSAPFPPFAFFGTSFSNICCTGGVVLMYQPHCGLTCPLLELLGMLGLFLLKYCCAGLITLSPVLGREQTTSVDS